MPSPRTHGAHGRAGWGGNPRCKTQNRWRTLAWQPGPLFRRDTCHVAGVALPTCFVCLAWCAVTWAVPEDASRAQHGAHAQFRIQRVGIPSKAGHSVCGMARHWEPRGKRPKMMSKSLIIVPMSALATPFRVVVLFAKKRQQSSSSSSNRIDPLLAVYTGSGALVLDLLTWDLIVCEHTRWRLGCQVKGLEGYGAGDQTRFAATSSVYLLPSSPFSALSIQCTRRSLYLLEMSRSGGSCRPSQWYGWRKG